MNITLSNGLQLPVVLPQGATVGHVRTLTEELERLGVPGAFSFGVNAVGVEDSYVLAENDVVTFRPLSGDKGNEGTDPAEAPAPAEAAPEKEADEAAPESEPAAEPAGE